MNFWKIMNLVAWGLSIYLLAVMLLDFFRVEKEKKHDMEKMAGNSLSGSACEDWENVRAKERAGQPE